MVIDYVFLTLFCVLEYFYSLRCFVSVPVLPEYFFKKYGQMENELTHVTTSLTPVQNTTHYSLKEWDNVSATFTTNTSSDQTACHMTAKDNFLGTENLYIGILFASKPLVQIVANAIIGPITDRIGFSIPMFIGYVVICASAIRK